MDLRDDLPYRFGGAEWDGPRVKVAIPDGKDLRQIQFQFAQPLAAYGTAEAGDGGGAHAGARRDVGGPGMNREVHVRKHQIRDAPLGRVHRRAQPHDTREQIFGNASGVVA